MPSSKREQEPVSKVQKKSELSSVPELTPEQLFVPEVTKELKESGDIKADHGETIAGDLLVVAPPTPSVGVSLKKDRLEKEIESILEEGLTDLYLKLPADKQAEFKAKGEEVVLKIRELVRTTKINMRKIFKLIRDWLKIIPGVNRFFLIQEAKIKTDKILIVTKEEKKRSQSDL